MMRKVNTKQKTVSVGLRLKKSLLDIMKREARERRMSFVSIVAKALKFTQGNPDTVMSYRVPLFHDPEKRIGELKKYGVMSSHSDFEMVTHLMTEAYKKHSREMVNGEWVGRIIEALTVLSRSARADNRKDLATILRTDDLDAFLEKSLNNAKSRGIHGHEAKILAEGMKMLAINEEYGETAKNWIDARNILEPWCFDVAMAGIKDIPGNVSLEFLQKNHGVNFGKSCCYENEDLSVSFSFPRELIDCNNGYMTKFKCCISSKGKFQIKMGAGSFIDLVDIISLDEKRKKTRLKKVAGQMLLEITDQEEGYASFAMEQAEYETLCFVMKIAVGNKDVRAALARDIVNECGVV